MIKSFNRQTTFMFLLRQSNISGKMLSVIKQIDSMMRF